MIKKLLFPTISESLSAYMILFLGLIAAIIIRIIMIFFIIEFDFSTGDTASYIEIAKNIIEFGIYVRP